MTFGPSESVGILENPWKGSGALSMLDLEALSFRANRFWGYKREVKEGARKIEKF